MWTLVSAYVRTQTYTHYCYYVFSMNQWDCNSAFSIAFIYTFEQTINDKPKMTPKDVQSVETMGAQTKKKTIHMYIHTRVCVCICANSNATSKSTSDGKQSERGFPSPSSPSSPAPPTKATSTPLAPPPPPPSPPPSSSTSQPCIVVRAVVTLVDYMPYPIFRSTRACIKRIKRKIGHQNRSAPSTVRRTSNISNGNAIKSEWIKGI